MRIGKKDVDVEVRRLMLSYLNGIQVQISVEVLRGNLLVMKNLFVLYIVELYIIDILTVLL